MPGGILSGEKQLIFFIYIYNRQAMLQQEKILFGENFLVDILFFL